MNKTIPNRGVGWFALSMAISLGTFFITGGIMSIPPNTRGIDVASGRELFTVHCGSCHFTQPTHPAHHGPNLHDIGRSAASRKPNQSAADYILESILDPSVFVAPSGRPGMPPDVAAELAPNEIRNIVGYLASRDAFPDYDEIMELDIPDRRREHPEPTLIRLKDMQLAEHVLREKGSCLKCHALYSVPEGMSFAPGLFGVGLNDAKAIHESLIHPHLEIKPQYKLVQVLLENGQIVSGQLLSRTDERLVLCARDEQNQLVLRQIPLADVEHEDGLPQIRESKISLMPEGFDKSLTGEEITAVINLIRQLN